MAVRAYLRTPAAVGWTVCGAVLVGAVVAVGWVAALAVAESGLPTNPRFLGGLGGLLYLAGFAVLLGVIAVVWLPFGTGVAYTVGRRARGDPVSFPASVSGVLDTVEGLAGWLKTRVAVEPVAERLLSEDDVAPNEVVTGCEKFVVPALVLDSPGSLPRAVERANRVTPRPGHERLIVGSLATTAVVAGSAFFARSLVPAPLAASAPSVAVALAVAGVVLTAALDAAWRAETYATQDLSEGFSE